MYRCCIPGRNKVLGVLQDRPTEAASAYSLSIPWEFKLEAVRLIRDRGASYAQASYDLNVHLTQLRNWVKALAGDPLHAFSGQGQMKPEQLEIAWLKREVIKLKAERDIKKAAAYFAKEPT